MGRTCHRALETLLWNLPWRTRPPPDPMQHQPTEARRGRRRGKRPKPQAGVVWVQARLAGTVAGDAWGCQMPSSWALGNPPIFPASLLLILQKPGRAMGPPASAENRGGGGFSYLSAEQPAETWGVTCTPCRGGCSRRDLEGGAGFRGWRVDGGDQAWGRRGLKWASDPSGCPACPHLPAARGLT